MRFVVFCALLGVAAAQSAASAAPDSVSKDGIKWWKTPLKAANANGLTAFSSAVTDSKAADLEKADFVGTMFAPTNAAMSAFSDDPSNKAILDDATKMTGVLSYHVVPGATLTAKRIKELASKSADKTFVMKTAQGEKINATVNGEALLINGAPVAGTEEQGGKTSIIAIEKVVVPPSLAPAGAAKAKGTGKEVPLEFKKPEAAEAESAAGLRAAAGLALALPAFMAALL